ncbi:sugar phosphate isomerase/epimerase family protein [Paenibacillus sp. strain BS8-2]
METIMGKALWGMSGTLEEKVEAIAQQGYNAVEGPIPLSVSPSEFRKLIDQYQLHYIAQMITEGNHEAAPHAFSFHERLSRAAEYGPLLVNCHTGRDSMEEQEQLRLFEQVLESESSVGLPVAHETHRSRCMFTPWTTAKLLRAYPELKLSADFSHWVCVTESHLSHYAEDVELALSRTLHVHGRVGFVHGPQVPDPRAPEYAADVQAHEAWWKQIYAHRSHAGASVFTFTPEYGPPGYMHTLPYTRQPLADLWEVCNWGRDRALQWIQQASQSTAINTI